MSARIHAAKAREATPHAFVLRYHSIFFRRYPEVRVHYPEDLRSHVDAVTPVFLDVVQQLRYPELLGDAVAALVRAHVQLSDDPHFLKAVGETLVDVLAMFCGERWTERMESTLWRIYRHYARKYARRPESEEPVSLDQASPQSLDGDASQPGMAAASVEGVVVEEQDLRKVPLIIDRTPRGSLADRPMTQLLYSLHKAHWTGTLVLTGETTIEVSFLDGEIGAPEGARDPRERVAAAFSWASGKYELDPDRVPCEDDFESFGHTEGFILRATESRVALNQAAVRMQELVTHYPAFTDDALGRLEALGKPALLTMLCQMCDGRRTLAALLETTWTDAQAMVRAAYYAAITNLVVLQPVATSAPIQVTYTNLRGAGGDKKPAQERRREALPPPPKVELSLEEAYRLLDCQPGCGTTAVNRAFVKLAARGLATRPKVLKAFEMLVEAEPLEPTATAAAQPARPAAEPIAPIPARKRSPAPLIRKPRGRTAPVTPDAGAAMPRRSEHTKARLRRPAGRNEVRCGALDAALNPKPAAPGDRTPVPSPRDTGPKKRRAPNPATAIAAAKSKLPPAEVEFNAAAKHLERNRRVEALLGFTKACELAPDNQLFRTELLWVTYLCDPPRAEEMLSELRGIRAPLEDKWDPASMFLRGRCNLVMGRIFKTESREEEAAAAFGRASEDNPKCIESRREERLCHMRQNSEDNDSWIKRLLKKEIGG